MFCSQSWLISPALISQREIRFIPNPTVELGLAVSAIAEAGGLLHHHRERKDENVYQESTQHASCLTDNDTKPRRGLHGMNNVPSTEIIDLTRVRHES